MAAAENALPSEALRLLRKEKAEVDRQIADLQARSRAYNTAIEALDGGLRNTITAEAAPRNTTAQTETRVNARSSADSIATVFATAVKDTVAIGLLPSEAAIFSDLKTNSHDAPDSFVVPNDAPQNAGQPVVEARAVRSWHPGKTYTGADLVDLNRVLAGLAAHEYKCNREHIWPLGHAEEKDQALAKASADALLTIQGASKIGFNITALRVNAGENGEDKPGFLYIIEDKDRSKMFVLGPAPIGEAFKSALRDNGVEYVQKAAPDAVTSANEFLANGAKWRGERGRLIQGNTQNVIESMIKACELIFGSQASLGNSLATRGATVGMVLKHAPNPAIYTNIVRPGA